ncbi:antigen 5 like allergen Cul n 1-like [Condylostylus longicornis]|uniref:antigen 5 like allergen Cul n 1-like n=1 Tax=Condylostylus longicornis TaxID=2530218 RepID=UPI00244DB391|nr:antigen 5 like allergen Cul n 1-like [Condylostylus longicornis]
MKFLIINFGIHILLLSYNIVEIFGDEEEFDVDSNILDHKVFYCKPDLCKIWNGTDYNYLKHIGCNNDGEFGSDCPTDATMVDMNQRRINLILDLHNIARNKIAMGEVPGFEPAENMPVLKWDNELQFLAGLNAKRCRFEHDMCRNTDKFEISGQNVGISWQKPAFHSNSKRIKLIVGLWFNEHKDANQSFIDAYEDRTDGKKIGHFTLMVSDRVKKVGCSAVRFSNDIRGRALYVVCNYDYNSIYGESIYKSGPSASNCDFRKSGRYRGLCDYDADYDESDESNEIDKNLLEISELL